MKKRIPIPSKAWLDERLKYNPDTGALTWASNGKDATYEFNGGDGYKTFQISLCTSEGSKSYWAHRVIWKIVTGNEPPSQVDHIDRNARNNRWENLRDGTFVNHLNRSKSRKNTSGVPGVVWKTREKAWISQVCLNKKQNFLGRFSDMDLAAMAVLEFRLDHGFTIGQEFFVAAHHSRLLAGVAS